MSTAKRDLGLYGGRRNGSSHLLGGVVSVLTGDRVRRVDQSTSADTGKCEFDGRDGKTVRRIVMPTEDKLPEGFDLDCMRGLLDHEAAHAVWSDFVGFKPANAMEMTVTNIIEDARIERLMRKRFRGSGYNIDAMNDSSVSAMDLTQFDAQEPVAQVLTALSTGLVLGKDPLERMLTGRKYEGDLRAMMSIVLPLGEAGAKGSTSKDAYEAARKVLAAIKRMEEEPPPPPQPKPGKPEEGEAEPSQGQVGGQDEQGADEAGEGASGSGKAEGQEGQETADSGAGQGESEDEAKAGKSEQAEPGNGGDNGESAPGRTRVFVKKAKEAAEKGEAPKGEPTALADKVYEAVKEAIQEAIKEDEKEAAILEAKQLKTGLYKPTYPWRLNEQEVDLTKLRGKGAEILKTTLDALRPVVGGLKTTLRLRILSEGKTKQRHGVEDGPLVSSRFIAALATGTSDRVFASFKRGRSRKTAITLLIDGSGSMNGYPVETATRTALAMTEALKGLSGVECEVLGFEYTGTSVRYVLKTFAQKDNSGIINFLNHSGNGNDDGLAVRWAARRLMAHKAERRILVVLSDGWPSDPVHGDAVNNDLKSAVGACERAGIETIGIGIVSEAVRSFYPKTVVVKKVEDLQGALLKELGALFDPAAATKGRIESRKIVA